jgi:hypothetical protein
MTKEELVKLDISIIRLKHEIKEIINELPTSYFRYYVALAQNKNSKNLILYK